MNLIEALQYLHDNPPSETNTDYGELDSAFGICYNLKMLYHKSSSCRWPDDGLNGFYSYSWVAENSKDWEHYSGNETWPIPGSNKHVDLTRQECAEIFWRGEGLAYRRSLLKHLMTKV